MNAPASEAKKLAVSELPPTAADTHSDGISPSWPGRPSRKPATSTPASSNGRICLAKFQLWLNHSPPSPEPVLAAHDRPITPAAKAIMGSCGKMAASAAVAAPAKTTLNQASRIQNTRMSPRPAAHSPVRSHLTEWTATQKPSASAGLPQLAKTSTPTMAAKKSAFCQSGRPASGSGRSAWLFAFSSSSLRKMKCMARPTNTENTTAPTARAMPSSRPRMRAVRMMASTLMAGPEYRKADAGPSPAPIR